MSLSHNVEYDENIVLLCLESTINDETSLCQLKSVDIDLYEFNEKSIVVNTKTSPVCSMWTTVLVQVFLRMPSPTSTTNIYQQMLDEARLFYENNPAQLSTIDKFEKEYRKEDAINWYSRDSFTY